MFSVSVKSHPWRYPIWGKENVLQVVVVVVFVVVVVVVELSRIPIKRREIGWGTLWNAKRSLKVRADRSASHNCPLKLAVTALGMLVGLTSREEGWSFAGRKWDWIDRPRGDVFRAASTCKRPGGDGSSFGTMTNSLRTLSKAPVCIS